MDQKRSVSENFLCGEKQSNFEIIDLHKIKAEPKMVKIILIKITFTLKVIKIESLKFNLLILANTPMLFKNFKLQLFQFPTS